MKLWNQEAVRKKPEILDLLNKCRFLYRDVKGLHLTCCITLNFKGVLAAPFLTTHTLRFGLIRNNFLTALWAIIISQSVGTVATSRKLKNRHIL